jgi:EAL domain-containing protein (putative c-di-GMP-specific phosphodiesterase class I)/GGDEF domain-containing protein
MQLARSLTSHNPASSLDALVAQLPDLVVSMRRDGAILQWFGGAGLPIAVERGFDGQLRLNVSAEANGFLRQTVKRALADRRPMSVTYMEGDRPLALRVMPQGPDRALLVIGMGGSDGQAAALDVSSDHSPVGVDRRGFKRRLKDLASLAALREQPLSVAILQLDGIPDIAEIIAAHVSEQLLKLALMRLSAEVGNGSDATPRWHLGVLSENTLALAIESGDRDAIGACVERIRANLRAPIPAGEAQFTLTPHAGVAVLNPGSSTSTRELIEQARLAVSEARQCGADKIVYFGDSVRLRSLARLDLGRELREAIATRQLGMRYVGRYELKTRRLVAKLGYVRWEHPLRGRLRPHEFLRVAGSTGLAVELSRAALEVLCEDFATRGPKWGPEVRVSFGPLRDHLLHADFVADIERVLDAGTIPAERLEIRIAERNVVAHDLQALRALQRRGVQLIVDEVGRSASALAALARTPIAGIQVDRAFVAAACSDTEAEKICRATFGIAAAFGVHALANGIDTPEHYVALQRMGCEFGSGDFFAKRSNPT